MHCTRMSFIFFNITSFLMLLSICHTIVAFRVRNLNLNFWQTFKMTLNYTLISITIIISLIFFIDYIKFNDTDYENNQFIFNGNENY